MPRAARTAAISFALACFANAASAQNTPPAQLEPPWYQTDFPAEEFRARWNKIFERIGDQAVAIVQGTYMTTGFNYPRQTNEFYYLSGVETPGSYILLDGRNDKVTLYVPPRNPGLENAEGRVVSFDDIDFIKRRIGVDSVASTVDMTPTFLSGGGARGAGGAGGARAGGAAGGGGGRGGGGAPLTIYTMFSPAERAEESRGENNNSNRQIMNDPWDGRLPREMHFISLLHARNPRALVQDLSPILDELRSIKSEREIALIRRASEIAGLGILEAMKSSKPGVYEYELDAAARYIFLLNGARLEGYRSIIAAGTQNIGNIHYFRNTSAMKDGDVVLMDYAPDYRYYTSDIGRMWPANGTFSPSQRELLQFILEYRNAIISRIRPGVTADSVMAEARAAMEPVFARTKFSKPIYEQAARNLVNQGGGVFSHTVGMAVHDVGSYRGGPLRPGQVFSVDPQLRVREEGLYMRYEDVGVVTATGFENFTDFLVSELNEIEKIVRAGGGIVQKVPPAPGTPKK
jgi:Xaa-Pro aminopeptidase